MSIKVNGKDITFVAVGQKAIATIYQGSKLVWEAIRSCFGKGFWVNEQPWSNDDAWKNNS